MTRIVNLLRHPKAVFFSVLILGVLMYVMTMTNGITQYSLHLGLKETDTCCSGRHLQLELFESFVTVKNLSDSSRRTTSVEEVKKEEKGGDEEEGGGERGGEEERGGGERGEEIGGREEGGGGGGGEEEEKEKEEGFAEDAMEPPNPPVLVLRGRRAPQEERNYRGSGEVLDVAVELGESTWEKLSAVIKEAETALFPWKRPKVRRVDCAKIFQGNPQELEKAKQMEEQQQTALASFSDQIISTFASNCSSFRRIFGFITSSLTEEERSFPLAYSLLVFKDAEQVVNLLRAIYRPQNCYCIHADSKSDPEFLRAVSAVSACFPNVFLSSRSVDVRWGSFTVLEPELICMADLWRQKKKKWKYFINLTGQEFPLRTNYELVKIFTAFNGFNSLEGTRKRANKGRWQHLGPPPGGITPTKGSVHITVNRDFVDFVLHSKVSHEFLEWVKKVQVPDEVFFSSLNHNPHLGIRGAYTGEPETHPTIYPFLTRYKNWGSDVFNYPCASGHRVRMICILSSGDLPFLESRPEFFANKFYSDRSRVALDCLAERLFNRTRDQFLRRADVDMSYYANLPFVKNVVNASSFERVDA